MKVKGFNKGVYMKVKIVLSSGKEVVFESNEGEYDEMVQSYTARSEMIDCPVGIFRASSIDAIIWTGQ